MTKTLNAKEAAVNDAEMLRAWSDLKSAAAAPGQPETLFDTYASLCGRLFGHRLLTILAWHPEADDTQRIFSTKPNEYPVGRRKPMGSTEWGRLVLKEGHNWIGEEPADIRWAFFDYALIDALGCGACLSVPVRWAGRTLAAVSMLGPAGTYRSEQLTQLDLLSVHLIPGLLASHSGETGAVVRDPP